MNPMVTVSLPGAEAVIASFGGMTAQVRLALRRAALRTAQHIGTMSRRQVAAELDLPVQAISRRYRAKPGGEPPLASLWVGTYGVDAVRLGRVRQNVIGTAAGRHFFRGAFHKPVYGYPGVFIRTGSPHYSPARYPNFYGRYRQGSSGDSICNSGSSSADSAGSRRVAYTVPGTPLRGRFPVVRISVPMHEAVLDSLDETSSFGEDFRARFLHELRFIMDGGKK